MHALPAAPPACVASHLTGSFAVVPNSEGAGNIVYRLRLTNASPKTCTLAGIPPLRLLDARGKPLPTHVRSDRPGALTVRVTLPPHAHATADARFSPDVPGPGEGGVMQQCEPTAAKLRVGRTLRLPIRPPTPVCEHGQLSFRPLVR